MGFKDRWDRATEWAEKTEAEAQAKKAEARAAKPSKQLISEVGERNAAGLACPKCGGTQFKAKRSAKGKTIGAIAGVAGAMLAPKSRVRCVTCKTEYVRG